MRYSALIMIGFLPNEVLAHDGFHVHPHGMEYGWIVAVVIGVVAGYFIAQARR